METTNKIVGNIERSIVNCVNNDNSITNDCNKKDGDCIQACSVQQHKYYVRSLWSIALSILSVIISASVAFICCPRNNAIEFDYLGVIIGAYSLLVTALIGWNIYSLVDIKNMRKSIEETFRKRIVQQSKQIEEFTRSQVIDTQIATNINNAIYYFQSSKYDGFLIAIANSLYLLQYANNKDKVRYCADRVNQLFDKRIDFEYDNASLDMLKEQLYPFISCGDYIRDLIQRIDRQKNKKPRKQYNYERFNHDQRRAF